MKIASRFALLALAASVFALGWMLVPAETATSAEVASPPAPSAADPWAVPRKGNNEGSPDDLEPPALFYDRFETFDSRHGLPSDKTTAVLPAAGDLWVGTDRGLALRRDGSWSNWSSRDGLAHDYVTSLAIDAVSGDLWVSTLGGLSVLSGGALRTYTQLDSGLMNDVVYQVVVRDRTIWAATAAGASRLDLDTGSWQLFDHENSIMHEPWCYSVTHGPGRVWIGVWGAGIVELDDTTGLWREYRDPDKEMEIDLLRDDGPIHDVTSWVAWEAGLLWQATYFGLSRYDGRSWRTFRREDTGIPGDFINHVAARGRVAFLGTDEGFGMTDGELAVSYRRTESGEAEVLVHRDGVQLERRLLDTAPGDNYILWTAPADGEVWLATGRGLSRGWAAEEKQP